MFSDGNAYERMMGRWSRLVGRQFLDWLALPDGLDWLDVGCGNGAFTEELVARCAPAKVNGIDPSDGQIAYARQRPGTSMARFEVGDAQSLPYGDASFDAASMALVISFIPDPAKAVSEMARVVRPGGTVATYMWDFAGGGIPLQPLFVALQQLGIAPPLPPGSAASSIEALQALWRGAGLIRIETNVIRIQAVYADFDDFWTSVAVPVGPQGMLIQSMPEDRREQLKARLRELLQPGSDGRIVHDSFANAVKGQVAG